MVVTDGLKTQESFQQDIATWLQVAAGLQVSGAAETSVLQSATATGNPLFYPSWEILPHEERLPHADVISERLETLVALLAQSTAHSPRRTPLIVTSLAALLQRTFPRETLRARTRRVARGERIEPLDLVEWLEEQGYEPEAQVTQKGELALRGGILDIFPLTSPWPVRLEFFGDELESLRHFDPLTQISREEIAGVTLPPAGELGLLKQSTVQLVRRGPGEGGSPQSTAQPLGSLLDYLPPDTLLLLCEPELLGERADEYERQVPKHDPFFIGWGEFREQAEAKGMTVLSVAEGDLAEPSATEGNEGNQETNESSRLSFESLDAYRPLAERPPEPQVAEAQRR